MQASDEQGLRCPKQECRKLFRKENLLMVSFINLYIIISKMYYVVVYFMYV